MDVPNCLQNEKIEALVLKSIRDQKLTVPLLKDIWKEKDHVMACSSTVKRKLIDARLNVRILKRKPMFCWDTKSLQWAKELQGLDRGYVEKIVWSDKPKSNLFHSDGIYIRCRLSEEFNEDCMRVSVKHGGGIVMIWGCVYL